MAESLEPEIRLDSIIGIRRATKLGTSKDIKNGRHYAALELQFWNPERCVKDVRTENLGCDINSRKHIRWDGIAWVGPASRVPIRSKHWSPGRDCLPRFRYRLQKNNF